MRDLAGYRGSALRFLKAAKAGIGDVLEVSTDWGRVTGTLVPRYLYADDSIVVLKLASGYNVGLRVGRLTGARVKALGEKPSFKAPVPPKAGGKLPRVLILGTGGTIASRVDYRTGAVHPIVTSAELHGVVPELSEIARVEPEIMFSIFSENVEPRHWTALANRVKKAVSDGLSGVVITHGTDTMGYTSAALGFALQGVPIPVVLVGAQRSPDRPSSDATLNLIAAVSVAATAPFSGVYVAMHLDGGDGSIAIHRATRVRKNHTSKRGAFESVGVPLAAVWTRNGLEEVSEGLPGRAGPGPFRPRTKFSDRVSMVKHYPSMPPSFLRALLKSGPRAIVFEGTGLGHINSRNMRIVGGFLRRGGVAFMTSQCINGRVDLNVYETGRDLLRVGVVPLADMLAETALVKAMWVVANSRSPGECRKMMAENLLGEMTDRGLLE